MKMSESGQDKFVRVYKDELVKTSTTSRGNQEKWFKHKNNMWIKRDTFGYEGLAESASSFLLSESNIEDYVQYNMCRITDGKRKLTGCASDNFLSNDEVLITLYRLFKQNKIDIYNDIYMETTEYAIEHTIDVVNKLTNVAGFSNWFGKLLEFDAFILNEDRHFANIAVIKNIVDNTYRLMPVFDNGLALLSDIKEYSMGLTLKQAVKMVDGKPFDRSLNKQARAVKNVMGSQLKLNKSILNTNTEHITIYDRQYVRRVIDIIKHQSDIYAYLVKQM